MHRSAAFAALGLAVALAVPAAASAGSVATRADPPTFSDKVGTLPGTTYTEFVADPGERNRLTVRLEAPDRVVFEDAGATIRAGRGCQPRSEHAVECPRTDVRRADLGDGDDEAVTETYVSVDGGAGADALRVAAGRAGLSGGPGDDRLTGGPDGDGLTGGPGADRLEGGPGADNLWDRDIGGPGEDLPGSDAYDGGPGVDSIGYEGRAAPLAIDLARGTAAGAAGERDALRSLEEVTGGDGNDRIAGTDGADVIFSGPGNDVVHGLGGDDQIGSNYSEGDRVVAGPGDDTVGLNYAADMVDLGPGDDRVDGVGGGDRVDAGPGDDRLGLFDAGADAVPARIRCGPGQDTGRDVGYVDPLLVPPDCEAVTFDGGGRVQLRTPLRTLGAAVARPRYRCPRYERRGCHVRFVLQRVRFQRPDPRQTAREPLLDTAPAFVRAGRRARLSPLRLSRAGRRLLARRGRLDVRVVVRRGEDGARPGAEDEPSAFVVSLRAPRRR